MSELTLFQGNQQLPDYLREADDFTKAVAGSAGGKMISIEGGVWRMIVGSEEVARNEERAMNFVVVNAARDVGRAYYDSVYVKGQATAPACYSEDGKAPSPNSERPQSSACATCPQNIKGSGQGEARACRFMQRIAVVLEGDLAGNVYRLQLPAKSIFGKPEGGKMPFQAYARFLAGHGAPMSGLVTEMRFDTSQAVPVLKFKAVRPLTREEVAISRAQGQTEDALEAIKVYFAPSKKEGQPALPAAFNNTDDDEPPYTPPPAATPEPTKRPSTPKVVKAAEKDVQALMDEWGTDDE